MWNRTLRCLRRVRAGECGLLGPGVGKTATLFLPRILVLLLQFEKLKLVARDPFLASPCPIAIFPPLLVKPYYCSWSLVIQDNHLSNRRSRMEDCLHRIKDKDHQIKQIDWLICF